MKVLFLRVLLCLGPRPSSVKRVKCIVCGDFFGFFLVCFLFLFWGFLSMGFCLFVWVLFHFGEIFFVCLFVVGCFGQRLSLCSTAAEWSTVGCYTPTKNRRCFLQMSFKFRNK